uniref:CUB domain-containing protein n=1 Tax=Parastrongyloides trichosuri TaxID=131310 RepID=A0A0N5A6U1_PARTI
MNIFCNEVTKYYQIYTDTTLTGNMTYFATCYPQGQTAKTPLANYTPPAASAQVASCLDNSGLNTLCTEGACGIFEFELLTPQTLGVTQNTYRYCPTMMINQIYLLLNQTGNTLTYKFRDSLPDASYACGNNTNLDMLSKDGRYSFYWYINCYTPKSGLTPTLKPMPNIEFYGTTTLPPDGTTQQISTTTKGSISNIKISISLLSLFLFKFFLL